MTQRRSRAPQTLAKLQILKKPHKQYHTKDHGLKGKTIFYLLINLKTAQKDTN